MSENGTDMNTPKRLSEKCIEQLQNSLCESILCWECSQAKELISHINALEDELSVAEGLRETAEKNEHYEQFHKERFSAEAQSWEDTAKKWRISAQSLYAENARLMAAVKHISKNDCYNCLSNDEAKIALLSPKDTQE